MEISQLSSSNANWMICVYICCCSTGETRVTTPTAIETQLPWKRNEDEAEGLQQNEFPAWSNNKEYLAYNSPSATFLGNLIFSSLLMTPTQFSSSN